MSNKMEEYADKLKNNNINDATEYINKTHDELVGSKVINTLPEWVFKEYFLEYFMSGGIATTDQPLYYKWIELSGGVYNEVNIIDENGLVVYTVPPLMINYSDADGVFDKIDFDNIIKNYNLRNNRTHTDGINYLSTAMNGMGDLVTPEMNAVEMANARWLNIFNRYVDPDKNIQEETTSDNLDNYINYD